MSAFSRFPRLPSAGRSNKDLVMRGMGVFWAGLLAGCTGLFGASYWEMSRAEVDETVAGPAVEVMPLAPVGADIPFGDFRYPHVDSLENVSFIVDPGEHHGIYRSYAGTRMLGELVKAGVTPLPGGAGMADYIRGLQMDGEDFVFNALDSEGGRGLYFWRAGDLRMVARTGGRLAEGEASFLSDVEYGSLSKEFVLFTAETPEAMALVLQNVWVGKSRVVLRTGEAIPGREGETFQYFSPQNWISGEDVVFRAARVGDPRTERTAHGEGVRGIYGWFGQMPANPEGFRLADLRTIADWTTPIPGMEGKRFTDFRSTPVRKGVVAFVGSGQGAKGVYLYNAHARDKGLRVIVDNETELPALFSGKFTGFGIFPTLVDDGVVFTGFADGGYAGVFLYQAVTDTLFVLTDNRQSVAGKNIRGFEIAGSFLVRNRFAVTANFEDGTSGVYLATIPVEGFTRMGAPGL
jgi:hypothetical protein